MKKIWQINYKIKINKQKNQSIITIRKIFNLNKMIILKVICTENKKKIALVNIIIADGARNQKILIWLYYNLMLLNSLLYKSQI
jgi:hypothetical protein